MKKLMTAVLVTMLMGYGLNGMSFDKAKYLQETEETLSGTLKGGMMAMGGDTTGWELKLEDGKTVDVFTKDGRKPAEDKDFQDRLQKLDGKKVSVKGKTGTKTWMERGPRKYIKVENIQEAGEGQGKKDNEGDKKWIREGECNGQHVGTADIGVCGRCAGATSSGSMKICKKCSEALGVCSFCLKKLSVKPVADYAALLKQHQKECQGKNGTHDAHTKDMVDYTCSRCGQQTGQSGGSCCQPAYCSKCAEKLGACPRCGKVLKEETKEDHGKKDHENGKSWIKTGKHDPKECCDGEAHIQPATQCVRCGTEWVSDGHDLCTKCADELRICYHCHRSKK